MPVSRVAKSSRRSKWFFLTAAVLFLFITISLGRELMRSYQIKKEIARLHGQIVTLESQNRQMTDFVEYLKTDAYFEEQARLKLNLKSEGEKLVVLQNIPDLQAQGAAAASVRQPAPDQRIPDARNNPSKWFRYFFGG